MDKLTNAFHTQMAQEKQKLWQLIKEKGSAGAYDRYKQTALERQKEMEANGVPVQVTISEEGMKSYRERITNGQSFEEVQEQRKLLLETKLSLDMNYKFTLSAKVNSLNEADLEASGSKYLSNEEKLDNIMEAYTSLYEEIVQGYESGTRVINVVDEASENGYHTLTMQEELADLDNAYESAVNTAVSIMRQSEEVAIAFDKYYAKLQRIGADRAELANAYAKQHAFDEEVVALDRKASHLPEYSGLFEVDKAIASALENCSKEEKGFVYDIIRQNFLVKNTNGMTEEERQANISLGMKKAEYAAKNFISSSQSKDFLDAMESVAKLATVGTAAEDGTMDYGVRKKGWLGEGSDLVYTDDPLDIMRRMDKKAYAEYERINAESDNESRALDALKYMMKWYVGAVQENPKMVEEYHKQSEEFVKKTVKEQKLDTTFQDMEASSKQAFLESLKAFCLKRPGFLTDILNREMNSAFWQK